VVSNDVELSGVSITDGPGGGGASGVEDRRNARIRAKIKRPTISPIFTSLLVIVLLKSILYKILPYLDANRDTFFRFDIYLN
jgi:hypothetical protein